MSTNRWADDSPEELDASLRREQGDEMADFLAAFVRGEAGPEPGQRKRGPRRDRVGNKEKHSRGIPQTKSRSGMTHKEANEARQYIQTKNALRDKLRRAVDDYGPDSDQAKAAAASLRAFITKD